MQNAWQRFILGLRSKMSLASNLNHAKTRPISRKSPMSKVHVLGSTGFLGKRLVSKFGDNCIPIHRIGLDFRLREDAICAVANVRGDIVINSCGHVGGIGENRAKPYEFYLDNLLLGTELMDAAYYAGAKKFVQIGTV